MKTLSEITKTIGLSRREIQCLENYNNGEIIKKPVEKNNMGYLLYDDEHEQKLWHIKLLKSLGYKDYDEILTLLNSKEFDYDAAIAALEKQKKEIDKLISLANYLKVANPVASRSKDVLPFTDDFTFDDTVFLIDMMNFSDFDSVEIDVDEDMFEKLYNLLEGHFDNLYKIYINNKHADWKHVEFEIKKMYDSLSPYVGKSSMMCFQLIKIFLFNQEIIGELDDESRENYLQFADFINNAMNTYSELHDDRVWEKIVTEIGNLGIAGHRTTDKIVQEKVKQLYEIYKDIVFLGEDFTDMLIDKTIKMYKSKELREHCGYATERNPLWFIGRSLEIYKNNVKGGSNIES